MRETDTIQGYLHEVSCLIFSAACCSFLPGRPESRLCAALISHHSVRAEPDSSDLISCC